MNATIVIALIIIFALIMLIFLLQINKQVFDDRCILMRIILPTLMLIAATVALTNIAVYATSTLSPIKTLYVCNTCGEYYGADHPNSCSVCLGKIFVNLWDVDDIECAHCGTYNNIRSVDVKFTGERCFSCHHKLLYGLCENCGSVTRKTDKYCRGCGYELEEIGKG